MQRALDGGRGAAHVPRGARRRADALARLDTPSAVALLHGAIRALPARALAGLRALAHLALHANRLSGALPSQARRAMARRRTLP